MDFYITLCSFIFRKTWICREFKIEKCRQAPAKRLTALSLLPLLLESMEGFHLSMNSKVALETDNYKFRHDMSSAVSWIT